MVNLVGERVSVDSQAAGRERLIAAASVEGRLNVALLELFERLIQPDSAAEQLIDYGLQLGVQGRPRP